MFSQNSSTSYFLSHDESKATNYNQLFVKHTDSVHSTLRGRSNKEYKSFCVDRQSIISKGLNSEQYLFDDVLYPKLNEILTEVKSANPDYKLTTINRVLVGYSVQPNAYCFGNDVLVFNIGLLNRLQTEDQIAFIIAHELSHQILNHVDTRVLENIAFYDSDEYKSKMKAIKKQDLGKNTAYNDFFLGKTIASRKLDRYREIQADSLGVELLKNTRFNTNGGISTLHILDNIDQEKYKDSISFSKVFSSESYLFDKNLLKKRNGLDIEQAYDTAMVDSLKTHPDCKERIEFLTNHFSTGKPDSSKDLKKPDYLKTLDYEIIKIDYTNKRYGRALKNALLLNNVYPENKITKTLSAIFIAEIYLAQKNHIIRELVPPPSDDYEFNYHRMLAMISNVRLSELEKIYDSYRSNVENQIKNDSEHYAYLNYLDAKIKQNNSSEQLREEYLKNFKNGMYRKSLINSTTKK